MENCMEVLALFKTMISASSMDGTVQRVHPSGEDGELTMVNTRPEGPPRRDRDECCREEEAEPELVHQGSQGRSVIQHQIPHPAV